ncbi:MAG TPA: methyltransferase [Micromonosporaceae bacterium]|nr:methyltransferase [Micromonosporaceae bacterium]
MADCGPLLDHDGISRLRTALASAGYTAAGIADRLGPAATAAATRNDLRPALRATQDRDRLGTLVRLFVCAQTEPADAVAAALAPLPLAAALRAGLVEPHRGGLRQAVDLEPYGEQWWVVSDVPASARPGRPLPGDHVLGVGGASTTLADATVRAPVGSALDVGTGCGVQALHLSTHAHQVTATDVSARALRFAATTAALSGVDWELLRGDLTAPVAGRRFDLVVSNPPFVAGPGVTTHTYRDSGRAGDAVCTELAAAAPRLLTDGGVCQFLANWLHVAGEDWTERVAGWVAGTGLDAWVIQREVADPLAYVQLWQADAAEGQDLDGEPDGPGGTGGLEGTGARRRAEAWLDWFDAHKVEAVGFGLVTLRAAGRDRPVVRVEELRQQVEPPVGAQVAAWFARQDWLARQDRAALLAQRYRAADGLTLRQDATLGPVGWAVDRQVLALPTGLRWAEETDQLVVALVGGCDGRVPLRDQLTVLAAAHDVPEEDLAEAALPLVAHLVERGFVTAVEG